MRISMLFRGSLSQCIDDKRQTLVPQRHHHARTRDWNAVKHSVDVCNRVKRLKGARAMHKQMWISHIRNAHRKTLNNFSVAQFGRCVSFFGQLQEHQRAAMKSRHLNISIRISFRFIWLCIVCVPFLLATHFSSEWARARENFSFISMMDLDLHVVKRNE